MIPPYPAPLTVLHPVHIPKNADPKKAIELLTCKIDQITRLLHEYIRYQEPLAECIEKLRRTHEEEFVDAFDALQLTQRQMQELKDITIRLREEVAGETQRDRTSESGSRAGSGRQKKAATNEKGRLTVYPPSPVPPFKPAIEGKSSKAKPKSKPKPKAKSKSKSKKSQEPTELSLQLEAADKNLRELLSFVYADDHDLALAHEEELDEQLSSSRYGCFKALAANCYIVREWQREQTDLISDMWDIRAEISDMYAEAKEASDATDHAIGYTANNKDKAPSKQTDRDSSSESATSEQSSGAQLKDLNQVGDKVDDADLDAMRPTYTFRLSIALPESKKLDKLTKAEAIQILSALPLSVSFCVDRTDCSAPLPCDEGAEGESTHFSLCKSPETGQWSQDMGASGSQPNSPSQTTPKDSEWSPVIIAGKGERAYPASWKSKNTEVYSMPGKLIAAKATTRHGPAPPEEQRQSSQSAADDDTGAEERTQTRSKKGKSKASSTDADAEAEAEMASESEPANIGRKTRKRSRGQVEEDEKGAEPTEVATSGSARRTSKRTRKSDRVESTDVEDDSDTKRLRKKRKVSGRK